MPHGRDARQAARMIILRLFVLRACGVGLIAIGLSMILVHPGYVAFGVALIAAAATWQLARYHHLSLGMLDFLAAFHGPGRKGR